MDGTRDLSDRHLDEAADASLEASPEPRRSCVFCSLVGDYAMHGRFVCQDCARELYHAYRRNKRLREAMEHGVVGCGTPEAVRLREFDRRRA